MGLTPGMVEVLQLAADGYGVSESATRCGIGYAGVRRRRGRALEQLGADNLVQAVAMAMRRGFIK